MAELHYLETPCVKWEQRDLPLNIFVKLECANHPFVSGNKWWKLKYNLQRAATSGLPILTFGGAYSNHIFATAAAAHELGMLSIGIIRGEEVANPTLEFARRSGMTLEFATREQYRRKTEQSFVEELRGRHGDFFLLPEGGTNTDAIKGCYELGLKLCKEISFNTLCLPVGTGGTMAGVVSAMDIKKTVVGFCSLKGGSFLEDEVKGWLREPSCDWRIETSYHFGGYARTDGVLMRFIEETRARQGIVLDPVYTSKMMFGVIDLARRGKFKEGSTVLVLHTGGLQGNPCRGI